MKANMMKTAARIFFSPGCPPLHSHRGLFRINWTAGAINLRKKKHGNPRDWPHPSFLWQTPTWQRHHSIERGTCLFQGQFIHVCREVLNGAEICFCICGTFCASVIVCVFGKSLFRMALCEILHFSVRSRFGHIYWKTRKFVSTTDHPYASWSNICMQLTLFFCSLSSHDLAPRVWEIDSFTASTSHDIWGVSSPHQSSCLLLLRSPLIYHPPVKTTKTFTPTEHQHTLPIAHSRSFMTLLGTCLFFLARVTDITSWKKWRHWEKTWQLLASLEKVWTPSFVFQHIKSLMS